jgi:hypothetical protein
MEPYYRICVRGHFDLTWSDWFDGFSIHHADSGETVLLGPIPDQSALYGVLITLCNLGMSLISLNLVQEGGESRAVS